MPVPVLPVPCPPLEYPSKVLRSARTPPPPQFPGKLRQGGEPVHRRETAPALPVVGAGRPPVAGAIGFPCQNTPAESLLNWVEADRSRSRQTPALRSRATLIEQQGLPRDRRPNLRRR